LKTILQHLLTRTKTTMIPISYKECLRRKKRCSWTRFWKSTATCLDLSQPTNYRQQRILIIFDRNL